MWYTLYPSCSLIRMSSWGSKAIPPHRLGSSNSWSSSSSVGFHTGTRTTVTESRSSNFDMAACRSCSSCRSDRHVQIDTPQPTIIQNTVTIHFGAWAAHNGAKITIPTANAIQFDLCNSSWICAALASRYVRSKALRGRVVRSIRCCIYSTIAPNVITKSSRRGLEPQDRIPL